MLARVLTAVGTPDAASYICTDNTGTLTQNKIVVTQCKTAKALQLLYGQPSPLEPGMALSHTVWQVEPN
jgi:P-type Ca2+ transporter type 2C